MRVAAPSANRFGRISPTTAAARDRGPRPQAGWGGRHGARRRRLSGRHRVDDRRPVRRATPRLLRPGVVTREQLEAVLGVPVDGSDVGVAARLRRAGEALCAAYAAGTGAGGRKSPHASQRLRRWRWPCWRRTGPCVPHRTSGCTCWRRTVPSEYARTLYDNLRRLDAQRGRAADRRGAAAWPGLGGCAGPSQTRISGQRSVSSAPPCAV